MFLWILITPFVVESGQAAEMKTRVDGSDLPRGLIHTETEYTVRGGTFELFYPEWIPGIHAPGGPIANLAEIAVQTPDGQPVPWRRDPLDVVHFFVDAPANAKRIIVRTTYICNQPSRLSTGVDSYGSPFLGILSWNTFLLYPADVPARETQVNLTLTLPAGWKWGASLKSKSVNGDTIQFESLSFEDLVDSPLICGEHFRTYDITPDGKEYRPHFYHVVSESSRAIDIEDAKIQKLKKMAREAYALFGVFHFDEYHLLHVLSDSIPGIGMEHLRSSLNASPEKAMTGEGPVPGVLSHEYAHGWCGKYHTPAGMITPNFNTPRDTRLLWVYEGLDQYLGKVLWARSGLNAVKDKTPYQAALEDVAAMIRAHINQKGRRTIPLEDTAASTQIRRGGSRNWRYLQRAQDYYNEGAMLWLEIDAILRQESEGKISLDDFCKRFLGRHEEGKTVVGYTEADIVAALNELHSYDWAGLIEKRVRAAEEHLPLEFLTRCGYRLQYSHKPTDFDKDMAFTSLGMQVGGDGKIQAVVPGGAADAAGLYDGAEILGVNNKKFSQERLEDAIAESVAARKIDLLVVKGELIEKAVIEYADGPRYIDLVRDPDAKDLFQEIWKPKGEE
ncbi:MAG: PDZ domain-containing protein [bacterium]